MTFKTPLTKPTRLRYYRFPLPMTDEPGLTYTRYRHRYTWKARAQILYAQAMSRKKGGMPTVTKQTGVWFWGFVFGYMFVFAYIF